MFPPETGFLASCGKKKGSNFTSVIDRRVDIVWIVDTKIKHSILKKRRTTRSNSENKDAIFLNNRILYILTVFSNHPPPFCLLG